MSLIQYVSLVSGGGQPVRVADQRGAPYPTTGYGALVFSNGAVLKNAIIEGATFSPQMAPTIYISDDPPPNALHGTLWWSSELGNLFVRYDDGSSIQWVPAMTLPVPSSRLVTTGSGIQMMADDVEVVINKTAPSPTLVALPIDAPFGTLARVSDGAGNASTFPISVQAGNSGTINGATGGLVLNYNWQTTQFRSFGGNAWGIL